MSYVGQNNAIRGLRDTYPNASQRGLAKDIRSNEFISELSKQTVRNNNLTARTEQSIYGVIRRHDLLKKQQANSTVKV